MPKKIKKTAPTLRLKKALAAVVVNGGNWYRALKEAGFSEAYSRHPEKIKKTANFKELADKFLPDFKILATHSRQLNAHRLDHMVFPLGPNTTQEDMDDEMDEKTIVANSESVDLTDEEIIQMLAEVNCTVRKIIHGEQARHVYFWSDDNKSQLAATELAYKIKKHLIATPNPIMVPVQVNIGEDRKEFA